MAGRAAEMLDPSEIDDIISTKLPSLTDDPDGYKVVTDYMLHGPCGKDARYAACTTDGKCSKHFPKAFLPETFLDEERYPHYRRRDNKVTVKKGKFTYNNKYVVPHNRYLILQYNTHINVEWCNRSKAIKYLLKYFNKGPDRATIVIEENVKNGATLASETIAELRFHLPNQNAITMRDSESLPALLQRECNNVTMGVQGFEELMTVNNRTCPTFKEACFAHGLLNDDKEWTKAISEESLWALGPQLRDTFITMLLLCDVIASSGISSLLLPTGRTSDSKFVIPVDLMENNTCGIKPNTQLAELLEEVHLIIWDEAPMTQRYAFEALDITLRDILGFKCPGKRSLLFGGNFRKILPVIPKAKRLEIVQACINRRLIHQNKNSIGGYWVWVTKIYQQKLKKGRMSQHGLRFQKARQTDKEYLKEREIPTPRNEDADAVNEFMFKKLSREAVTKNSADEICRASTDNIDQHQLYPVEFLNSLNFLGMPPHELCLKKELPIMLLRNVNPSHRLCFETRLIITDLAQFVIHVKILTGSLVGDEVVIHRIILTSTRSKWPFVLKRRQFPIKP
nr:ATP-dependent DNA helicase PIF1-like [Tanacetum cinerariifolium]